MSPTPEGQAILDKVAGTTSNLMIRARAGCGKTTMLSMIDALGKSTTPHLLICFNKAIAVEAEKKVRSVTTVRTFNSLGHRIWADFTNRRLSLAKNKTRDIFLTFVEGASKANKSHLWSMYDSIIEGVNLAKALGYIPPSHAKAESSLSTFLAISRLMDIPPSAEVRALVDKVLNLSIAQAYSGVIDFSDQVYMPALFGGRYPTFPLVMIDEYQDLSPVNRSMVAKLCKSSRQIGVGDEAQSIYAFRGADVRSMGTAIEQFSMAELPLSVSFRCPTTITSNVHWHVPDIRSFGDGGSITHGGCVIAGPSTAVICRYNAPLIAKAMALLASGTHVNMSGVDIGAKLTRMMSKLGPGTMTRAQTLSAINDWQAEKESNDSRTAADFANCMRTFAGHASSLDGAIAYATHLFASTTGEINFMSGHRSKGLEFDHVYHLNSASIDKSSTEEANIHYVIDTRPSKSLTYIQ